MSKLKMPICPYCLGEMYLAEHEDNYFPFTHWMCECDDDILDEKLEMNQRRKYGNNYKKKFNSIQG